MKHISAVGGYFLMLYGIFRKQTQWRVLKGQILKEIVDLMYSSIVIVAFISFFVGGVLAVQMSLNMANPFVPKSLIGFATRQSFLLEFAPTFMSVVMAGKVGSFITSSIGTMRVTEQIDALDVMGVNSLNYLIFPKIIALLFYPFLIALSMFLGMFGGLLATSWSGFSTPSDFIEGLQFQFKTYDLLYAFTKTLIYAFILATIPSYHGYYMKGGALDVGKASTISFVWTSVVIIFLNFVVTQLFYG